MKFDSRAMLVYGVSDRAWVGKMTLYQQVEAALQNGMTCLQLREKDLDPEHFLEEARQMGALCKAYRVPFIINDNVEIALACQADGIHVGQDDMAADQVRKLAGEEIILGVSVHTVEEAKKAVADGADYLGAGAAFSTSTKTDVDVMSEETMRAICSAVDVPVVAIGGITADNLMELSGRGIAGVAVVSAIFGAEDPGAATAQLLERSEAMVKQHG